MLMRKILAASVLIGAGLQPSQAPKPSAHPQPPRGPEIDLLKQKGVARSFKVNGKYIYIVDLKKDQALQVIVQQDGADVQLNLYGPAGKLLTTVDSHNGNHGPEPVLWVAQEAGRYRMVVSNGSEPSATARYFVQMAERRSARPDDLPRSLAMRKYYQGRELLDHDLKKAAEVLLASARDLEQAGDLSLCAEAWQDLGLAYVQQQQWQRGIQAYERAALQFHRLGKRSQEALSLNEAACSAEKASDVDKAQRLFKQALAVAREAKDKKTQASILINLGLFHAERGGSWEAGPYLQEAIKIWRELKDPGGEAQAFVTYGSMYVQMGEIESALGVYQSALRLPGVSSGVRASLLTQAGNAYVYSGRPDRALVCFKQALNLERGGKNLETQAGTLDGFGLAYVSTKRFNDALVPYRRSLQIFQTLKDPRGQATILMNLGWALGNLTRYDEARDSFNQALGIARSLRNPVLEAGVRLGFAWTERRRKKLSEAQRQAEKALALIEGVRNGIEDRDLQLSFFSRKQDVYELLIGVLMEKAELQSSNELAINAFQVSE